jgi:hypothetical protein
MTNLWRWARASFSSSSSCLSDISRVSCFSFAFSLIWTKF